MATMDLGRPHIAPLHHILEAIDAALAALAHRRARRQTLYALAHLDPRLIADAGLDPDQVRSAVAGWDRLDPVGLRLLLPHAAA